MSLCSNTLFALLFQVHNTYQYFTGCQSRSSSDALNTASVERLRQEQSTAEQFWLKPRTEHQCVLFYEYELLAMYRLNVPYILTLNLHLQFNKLQTHDTAP